MPLEVIGAGFGRTGTLSLKYALEELGYVKCHHMMEVFKSPEQIDFWVRASRGETMNWDEVFEGFRASVDWPSAAYCLELAEAFPDAKIILGVRDPEAWYKSVSETIYPVSYVIPEWIGLFNRPMRRLKHANIRKIWRETFDGRFEDKAHAIAVFEKHIETVKAAIPPERLLLHQPADGWEPLCEFLGKPIPEKPYPRVNESRVIARNVKRLRWIGRAPWILGAAVLAALLASWLL